MRCADIMKSHVVSCHQDDTVRSAAVRMREHNVGCLPIVDRGGRLVGLITDRDLALRVLADDVPASTQIVEVMSKALVTCHPEDHLQVAEEKMAATKKSRILVVGDAGELRGVISLSDIAQAESKRRSGRLLGMVTRREAAPPPA